MVISDLDISISWGFFMAKKSKGKRISCKNCRTPDWKSADGKWCYKRRIELDPADPVPDCPYWRQQLPLKKR